ncbi:MAG: hypothetical protein LBP95_02500 [Deltaproteobacteria bacterium]|nr:hypothetical protein [Deltaproteobacteria bacterium]
MVCAAVVAAVDAKAGVVVVDADRLVARLFDARVSVPAVIAVEVVEVVEAVEAAALKC